jgi:1,4-alpha-glucan branching enzyme
MAMLKHSDKLHESRTRSTQKGDERDVDFSFHSPKATKVFLAGKFNAWNTRSLPMKKGKDDVWRITITLVPGLYEYKYFVDGTWASEETCAGLDRVLNPFGTYNCVITVH